MRWTFFRAFTASITKILINMRDIVFQSNGASRAVFCADAAADTASIAHIPHLFALFLGEAADNIGSVIGYQFNQVVRANFHTFSAGTAGLPVDNGTAVDNLNGAKRTSLCTGTQP